MQLFLAEVLDTPQARLGETETKHCIRVLRHKRGDLIDCIDGKGHKLLCRIVDFSPRETLLEITETIDSWGEHTGNLQLAISPLRLKDRFEWIIEKAVELGVNEIFPVSCQHTDKYQSKFKPTRLETIILTALKQCKRSHLPILHPLQPLNDLLSKPRMGDAFIAYGDGDGPLQQYAERIQSADNICLLIGPEGDFTPAEVDWAKENGFTAVQLGHNRLRTETAGVYALSVVKMLRDY
ncbi:MAG: RsmE family RNA methyltransferase [Bacteroidota bacterium]